MSDGKKSEIYLNRSVEAFRFVSLVTTSFWLVCALEIFFLRPEVPGSLLLQVGDIDNKLMTLFDALRMPKTPAELPKRTIPASDEVPFFYPLADDNHIYIRLGRNRPTLGSKRWLQQYSP